MSKGFRKFKLHSREVMPFKLMTHLEGKENKRVSGFTRKKDAILEANYFEEKGHEVRITKSFNKWYVWRF